MALRSAGATARQTVPPNAIEVRLAGGILALNRFLMTLQNKRMPVAGISVESDNTGTLARFVLDCPEEGARRYAALLENLEDVEEVLTPEAATARTKDRRAASDPIDYDGRRFRPLENSGTGEVGPGTVFSYAQDGDVVRASYEGGGVRHGSLIATVDEEGCLDARYQHVNADGDLMTGECRTTPEVLPDGRLRLNEAWRWTSGDGSPGRSVVEEIGD